jgi:hypothetical protein
MAEPAKKRRSGQRSASPSTAETKVPATKPSCTEAASQPASAEEMRLRAQAYKPPNNLLKGVPKAKFDDQFQARTFFSHQRVSSGTSRIDPVQV